MAMYLLGKMPIRVLINSDKDGNGRERKMLKSTQHSSQKLNT